MIHLQLIRHGATPGNLERRYIGRTDEGLSDQGREQILALKERLRPADRIFVSPMLRTRQTAELLFPDQEHTLVPGFEETDFGIFEGKTADELSTEPAYQAWVDAMCMTPIPGGEAVEDFRRRYCENFQKILSELPDGSSAALVIHGGGIMAVLEHFARPHRDFYDYHVANGTVTECDWNGTFLSLI